MATGLIKDDLPTIVSANYYNTGVSMRSDQVPTRAELTASLASSPIVGYAAQNSSSAVDRRYSGLIAQPQNFPLLASSTAAWPFPPQTTMTIQNARIVDVYICDPDVHLPVLDRLIYVETGKVTDEMDDRDLLMSLDIKGILDRHNAKRKKETIKVDGKKQALPPIKLSQLNVQIFTRIRF
jgi:hypothetical protein